MQDVHFLGNINEERWLDYIRTFLLFRFGPGSRATLHQYLRELRATPHKAFELDPEALGDFSVQQVDMEEVLNLDEPDDFYTTVRSSQDPFLVPQEVVSSLLALPLEGAYELKIGRLALLQDGTLTVSVSLPTMFDGGHFVMKGALDLEKLA